MGSKRSNFAIQPGAPRPQEGGWAPVRRVQYTVPTPLPEPARPGMLNCNMKTPCAVSSRRSTSSAPPSLTPRVEFKAFIAYADLNAARQAMRAINEVLQAAPRCHELQPMLWRYDQICSEKWRESSLLDAAKADVVVVASSLAGAMPALLEHWVGDFLAHMRGARTTLVALLGHDDAWTISIEGPRVAREPGATMTFPRVGAALSTRAA